MLVMIIFLGIRTVASGNLAEEAEFASQQAEQYRQDAEELEGELETAKTENAALKEENDSLKTELEEAKKIKADVENFATNYPTGIANVNIDGIAWNNELTIVGVIDDKTDFSAYEAKTDEELLKDEGLDTVLNYGFTNLVYLNKTKYDARLAETTANIYYRMDFGFDRYNSISSWNIENRLTIEDYNNRARYYYEQNGWWDWGNDAPDTTKPGFTEYTRAQYYTDADISAVKSGVDIFNLAKDEIIVDKWAIQDDIADFQTALDNGLTVKMKDEGNDKIVVKEFKVVGVANQYYFSEAAAEELKPLFSGYDFAVAALNGTSEDETFVKRLETFDEHNVRYTIQNASTPMLDMLEDMLLMMTGIFVWIALGFAVFAALMLMNFISTSISYKKREIGVLRALGARGSDVFGIFFNESLIIALINFVLSAIATIVVCNVVNGIVLAKLPVDIVLLNAGVRQLALILGVSVLSAFLGSFLPTFKISRKRPIDAINNR